MTNHPLLIDPAVFDPSRIDPELAALNVDIAARQKALPSPWSVPVETVRQARKEGKGIFPAVPQDPAATMESAKSRAGGTIPLRVFRPATRAARGTYLHIHGGGWVFGSAQENDARLRRLAENTGLAVASVDYRLAPEAPYPAAADDCEDAALALLAGLGDLPSDFLAIGGESAGAHLSVLTLLRLRDDHGKTPFKAANLVAGCYDLSMTPSVRRFGPERLILNTQDIEEFVRRFVPEGNDRRDPAISPLYADLTGLPPALFSCGTDDLLLDDTLFMAARWTAAGNHAQLSLTNGGCHVFEAFPCAASDRSLEEMERFLSGRIQ